MSKKSVPNPIPFEQIGEYKYRIPRHDAMNVDAVFYASTTILRDLKSENYQSLRQLMNVATLPGIVEPALSMPDIHWGYGFPIGGVAAFDASSDGVVSPGGVGYDINCGVRLLASSLLRHELRKVQDRLADALYLRIPAGVGSRHRRDKWAPGTIDRILEEGARAMVELGYGNEDDLDYIESGGRLSGADIESVSPRAVERGSPQLGTLGSGNHFLEVQYVDEIYDRPAAEALGLRLDQITILIHTGSRGLGHQVCTDYVDTFLDVGRRYGIELVDRQLACAPIESPEGREYLGAMAASANFAFANRQRITAFARLAFEDAGFTSNDHGLRVVYDLAHNNAKFEVHGDRELLVHRKGATRAFGPGLEEIPEEYREVGQPVFVPGDMGRYSFVLVGTQSAMDETFGSACHGAGRRLSRRKAKKAARPRNIPKELEQRGILVRAASRATVDEEMPEAYKDVADVVGVVHGAGIGKRVARLRPMIVVKG